MAEDTSTDLKSELKRALEHWQPIYDKGRSDLKFLSDEDGAQWDAADYAARRHKKRPTLTIDQLGQFTNRVCNDIRMNTPTINVVPAGGEATVLTAAVYKGKIREIEQRSRADIAYDTAASFAVESSIGYIRVDHDYKNPRSFEQEYRITRVINPFVHFPDPDIIEPDGSDSKRHFVLEEMTKATFRSRWPGKEPVGYECESLPALPNEESIYVLEYFEVVETPATLYRLRDGQEGVIEGDIDPQTMGDVVASRSTTLRKVHRSWRSGAEVLEETTVPGEYIPIVPVFGKEAWRNGKRHVQSLIRKAKDAQRMYNYWKSMEVELLQKQPKAPTVAARGTIEAYADSYLHPDGAQVLLYEPYDEEGRPLPAPIFGNVPRMPDSMVLAARNAVDDIKATTGMYNASLGMRSNETSGKAITARKEEGDVAVYHFGANLVISIEHVGRILASGMPEIYDTPRVISVVGQEDTAEMIGINGALVPGQEQTINIRDGQYDVFVTTGAPFSTIREEAAEFYKQVVMTTPDLLQVIGDLVFKHQDFPGAQAISERLAKLLPPNLRGEEDNSEVQAAMQQIQQLEGALKQQEQVVQQLEQQLKDKAQEVQVKAQTELAKNETEKTKQQVEIMRLSLEQQQLQADIAARREETQLKREELEFKKQELISKLAVQASAEKGQPQF